jgi:zona occludens toxin
MAITTYNGPPGAGKSYAMISQVLVPGVAAGRRVVTNISGVMPDKVIDYCRKKWPDAELGEVVLFDGSQAKLPGFFPTEETGDDATFIKGGDLLIFDEWRLTFSNRGPVGSVDLEPFLRWHRHLVDDKGRATDVVIGTQLITDIHRDFRGLVEGSFKFRKLSAVGLKSAYQWDAFDGHLQPKGEGVSKGNGKYKKEIFALYKSYDTDAEGKELNTDKRRSLWSASVFAIIGGVVLMFVLGGWGVAHFFIAGDAQAAQPSGPSGAPLPSGAPAIYAANTSMARPKSPYRIVGSLDGLNGVRVVLSDDKGSVRVVSPDGFDFDGGRPIYGVLDGQAVVADDRLNATAAPAPRFGLVGQ